MKHQKRMKSCAIACRAVVGSLAVLCLWLISMNQALALPPLIHGGQERERFIMSDQGVPTHGLTIETIDELTRRLGLPVSHRACPFKRCINQLISGQMDLMMFITVNPRRAEAVEFIQVWPNPLTINFYTRAAEAERLQSLRDLMKLRIGYVKGFFYTNQLEQVPQEQHTAVIKEQQLPRMLLAGRIDAFPVYGRSHTFLDNDFPQLQLAPLQLPGPDFAILAISKKSPYLQYSEQMNRTLEEMAIDGTLDELWGRYHEGEKLNMPPELRRRVKPRPNGSEHE